MPVTPNPSITPDLPPPGSVDVVIATFNAPAPRLQASVRSALACRGIRRVVVVDDGSTPPQDHASLTGLSGAVEVIRQENAGPAAARNAGIERTDSPIVVFLDDDDQLLADGVAAMAELAAKLGVVAAVAARFHVWPDGREEHRPVPPEWAGLTLPHPSHVLRPIGLFGASGCMVHRKALAAGLRFDPDLRLGEDRDFLARAAAMGGLCVSSPPAVRVAMHSGETNLSSPAHYARRIRDHLIVLERYTDEIATAHMHEATRWLINASAKAGVDRESWEKLIAAATARGWKIPLKARVRYTIK